MKRLIPLTILAASLLLGGSSAWAQASPPELITYQGRLANASDEALTGTYAMTFKFYDASSTGTLLLTDTASSVSVNLGLFTVKLGGALTTGTESSLAGVFRNHAAVYLEMKVGTETLSPRVQMISAGYALNAKSLDGKAASSFLDTSATAQTKTGDLTVSGTISGSGSGLTGLNASNVASGTLSDARLSSNVALRSGNQTFTGINTFTSWIVASGGVTGLPEPADDEDAATKAYVDAHTGSTAAGWTQDGTVVHLTIASDTVGIGTDSPEEKLHVVGNILAEGNTFSFGDDLSAENKDIVARTAGANPVLRFDVTSGTWRFSNDGTTFTDLTGSTGTVTSVATGGGLTGGTITSTGTISIADDGVTSAKILNGTIVNTDVSSSAAITYGKLDLAAGIVNSDVSSSAAITYGKLDLSGGIINSDVASSAAITYGKLNLAGGVVNADVASSAAIAYSKLYLVDRIVSADISSSSSISLFGSAVDLDSSETSGVLPAAKGGTGGTGGAVTSVATSGGLTGGTITSTGTISIADDGVTSAKIADDAVVNADVASTAAIAYGKLNLAGGIVNADVNSSAAIAYGKLSLADKIVSADISSSSSISLLGSAIDLNSSETTGTLPVAKGGTGSATQNFVDLTTAQTVAGLKTFSTGITGLPAPANGSDAATKTYVDGLAGGGWTRSGTTVSLVTSTDYVGIGTSSPGAVLNIQGTGTSSYRGLMVQNTFSDATNKGAVAVVGSRKTNANNPFAVLGNWDSGTDRIAYIGGGNWSVPDSTQVSFYTASSYDESNGVSGNLRMKLRNGLVVGSPTGGDKGAGTVNAEALYAGGAVVSTSAAAADGITIDNTATDGDPRIAFQLSGTAKYTMGVDDSDSDKFKIGTTAVETSTLLTIDGNGYVGIGTSSPSVILDVESGGTSDGIDINNTAADGDPRIAFQLSGTAKFTLGVDDSDGDKLKIGTTAVDTSTRLTIDSSGNVGIGTASPASLLTVAGVMESTSGGVKFPDGTTQTTAAGALTNSSVSSTSEFSTTSTTDVQITSMTLTPASGTYLVTYSHWHKSSSSGGGTQTMTIYAAGSAVSGTVRSDSLGSNVWASQSANCVVTVNGSQAIEVKAKTSTGTWKIEDRCLNVVRIGS